VYEEMEKHVVNWEGPLCSVHNLQNIAMNATHICLHKTCTQPVLYDEGTFTLYSYRDPVNLLQDRSSKMWAEYLLSLCFQLTSCMKSSQTRTDLLLRTTAFSEYGCENSVWYDNYTSLLGEQVGGVLSSLS